MAANTAEKVFYIGKELFVKVWGPLQEPGTFDVDIMALGKTVGGTITFTYIQERDKPETRQIQVMVCIKDTGDTCMDVKSLHDVTGFILQNYRALAEHLGKAHDNGFFDLE